MNRKKKKSKVVKKWDILRRVGREEIRKTSHSGRRIRIARNDLGRKKYRCQKPDVVK